MVIDIGIQNTPLRPIIIVDVGKNRDKVDALVDAGSTKVIWCSKKSIKLPNMRLTGNKTSLSGIGVGSQKDCDIYTSDISIYSKGRGIVFEDVEIVKAKTPLSGFDMILPYELFHRFIFTFAPAINNKGYGIFRIDTLSNKIRYKVKSYGGVVTEVYEVEDEDANGKAKASDLSDELPDIEPWN